MPNGADVPSCLVPSSKGDRPNDAVAPRAGLTACFRQRPGAATHMAKLDHKRVDLFYEKLTGEKPDRRGSWKIEQRNIAQKPRSLRRRQKRMRSSNPPRSRQRRAKTVALPDGT